MTCPTPTCLPLSQSSSRASIFPCSIYEISVTRRAHGAFCGMVATRNVISPIRIGVVGVLANQFPVLLTLKLSIIATAAATESAFVLLFGPSPPG
jgi:hypothetical protein